MRGYSEYSNSRENSAREHLRGMGRLGCSWEGGGDAGKKEKKLGTEESQTKICAQVESWTSSSKDACFCEIWERDLKKGRFPPPV